MRRLRSLMVRISPLRIALIEARAAHAMEHEWELFRRDGEQRQTILAVTHYCCPLAFHHTHRGTVGSPDLTGELTTKNMATAVTIGRPPICVPDVSPEDLRFLTRSKFASKYLI
jgi:hypothetical protein